MNAKRRNDIIGFCITALYILIYLGSGEHNYQEIHDSLEYFVANVRSALLCGDLWQLNPNEQIDSMMGGVPRYCFQHGIDFFMVLFTTFKPFQAYAINFILVHAIAYLGFYLFFRDCLLNVIPEWKKQYENYAALFAACFSVLPLYPVLGFTFAGLPLLAWSFYNVKQRNRLRIQDVVIPIFFAFHSSFVYIGVFVLIIAGCIMAINVIRERKIQPSSFIWFCLVSVTYVICNYYLFYQVLFAKDFISHREVWTPLGYSWKISIGAAISMFTHGHYHAASHHFISLLLIILVIPLTFIKRKQKSMPVKFIVLITLIALLVSAFYGFWQWMPVVELKEKSRILKIFKWDRFYFFNPIIWTVLFTALTLYILDFFSNPIVKRILLILVLTFQLGTSILSEGTARQNVLMYFEKFIPIASETQQIFLGPDYYHLYFNHRGTFAGFFQEEVFDQIDKTIHLPKNSYRIGSVAVNPALALYNGFYTIDGYMTSYPKAHKDKILEVIDLAVDHNNAAYQTFLNWGGRCYLFSDIKNCSDLNGCAVNYNIEALKALNCRYLISSFRLKPNDQLVFVETYTGKLNPQKFYLYEIR
jgi:hypothetical protein